MADTVDALPQQGNNLNIDMIRDLILQSEERSRGEIRAATEVLEQRLNEQTQLLPIRLHNSRVDTNGELHYPQGVNGIEIARTKGELFLLTSAQCTELINRLGLRLDGNPVVEEKRGFLLEYLWAW